jgi:hypothetical protein
MLYCISYYLNTNSFWEMHTVLLVDYVSLNLYCSFSGYCALTVLPTVIHLDIFCPPGLVDVRPVGHQQLHNHQVLVQHRLQHQLVNPILPEQRYLNLFYRGNMTTSRTDVEHPQLKILFYRHKKS